MGTPAFVGIVTSAPNKPIEFRAQSVQFDGIPPWMTGALHRIWTSTFDGDLAAMAEALLAHDWVELNPGRDPAAGTVMADEVIHPGIGVAFTGTEPSEPVAGTLSDLGVLDVNWLYLIDVAQDHITVYVDDGTGHAVPTSLIRALNTTAGGR